MTEQQDLQRKLAEILGNIVNVARETGLPENQIRLMDQVSLDFLPNTLSTFMLKGLQYNFHPDEPKAYSNLVRVAALSGITPQQAALTLMSKHWDVLINWSKGADVTKMAELKIGERVGDIISYLFLILAMSADQLQEPKDG